MRILLVEDDVTTARGVTLALLTAKFIVDHTDLGEDALEMVRHYDYDVVLVGLKLPDINGLEVVRRMRQARSNTLALILSPDVTAKMKVQAFSVGADDFLVKPVDHDELIARLQTIVRRSKVYSDPIIQIGKLQLNTQSSEVSVDGKALHLTGKEFAILELLVMRKGVVLTKDAFLNHLYGGMDEPEVKIIDIFICKLCKKLERAGVSNLIETVWGRGYVLREEVAAPSTIEAALPVTTESPTYVM